MALQDNTPRSFWKDPRDLPLARRQWIIDGGYLSFTYGIQENLEGWYATRIQEPWNQSIVFLDKTSKRKELYPGYKARRKEDREKDPRKKELRQKVDRFRDYLATDDMVPAFGIDGLEADDLVAWWWIRYGPKYVIAIDKDLLQIPGIPMHTVGLSPVEPRDKLPKYMSELLPDPKEDAWLFHQRWLLFHVLRGDTSDSIPRILPSHGGKAKLITQHLCESRHGPFGLGFEELGDDFLRNLKLIALPWYQLRVDWVWIESNPDYFTSLFDQGTYWLEQFWQNPELLRLIADAYLLWQNTTPLDGGFDWETL